MAFIVKRLGIVPVGLGYNKTPRSKLYARVSALRHVLAPDIAD